VRPEAVERRVAVVDRTDEVREEMDGAAEEQLVLGEAGGVVAAVAHRLDPQVVEDLQRGLAGRGAVLFEVGEHGLVGAGEQSLHRVDAFGEQGVGVELAGSEAEPGAGAHLAAAFALAVGAVLADLLVVEEGVVEPGEHLRVQPLGVVALVEGVDCGLPVAVEQDRSVRAEPHLLEPVLRVARGDVTEERVERLAVGIHVDEDEATPPAHLNVAETQQIVGHRVGVVVTVDDLDDVAVEIPTPRVVAAADLCSTELADAFGEARAAVRARVEERSDRVGVAADDEDRLVADRVLQEVAGERDLFFPARDLPDPRPEPLHLEVEELAGVVPRAGDGDEAVRLLERERRIERGHLTLR
jgi:hypothetical protein